MIQRGLREAWRILALRRNMGEDSPQSMLFSASANDIFHDVVQSTGFTRLGVWEITVKSITLYTVKEEDSSKTAFSLECDLVRQIHDLKPAILEIFEITPNTNLHVHQGNCAVWHEVNATSTHIKFTLRELSSGHPVTKNNKIVIHLLYRRKR